MKKLIDFIFGVPDEIMYKQLLADKLAEIAAKYRMTERITLKATI